MDCWYLFHILFINMLYYTLLIKQVIIDGLSYGGGKIRIRKEHIEGESRVHVG